MQAAVEPVDDPVAIIIAVTGIADTIAVRIGLVRIAVKRAVVSAIQDAVVIVIRITGITAVIQI